MSGECKLYTADKARMLKIIGKYQDKLREQIRKGGDPGVIRMACDDFEECESILKDSNIIYDHN